jgi:hypothetical protein
MKRKEMIERLACFLSEEQGCRKVGSYAEMIIAFLESQGMQPPNVRLNQLFPNSDDIQLVEEENLKHWYACWEPEDAEK